METETKETTEAPVKGKSIVDPKYRGKYKNRSEWLSDLLKEHASLRHTIPAKAAVGEEGKEGYKPATAERTVVDGVDVAKIFEIGRENGLNLDKYDGQRDTPGFAGRIRMTVGNMLRSVAKQRHGLFINDQWQEAPAEWLAAQGVEGGPTHERDGTKIAKAKPETETKPEQESKLIKASEAKTADEKAAAAKAVGKKKK